MLPPQQRAIKNLEQCFAACARAGIAIVAMDNRLEAYDSKALDARLASGMDLHHAQIDLGQGILIDTHGVHRDSGGW